MNDTDNDAKKLWQDQPLEGMTMSLAQIHERIQRLSRVVRRRSLIGGFACLIVLLAFAYFVSVLTHPAERVERVGAILTVAGAAYLMYQLIGGKMKKRTAVAANQAEASVSFYRSELQRQRDFHQGMWLWLRILIFAPGPFIFLFGMAEANPELTHVAWIEAAIAAALLIYAVPRNLRLAKRLQQELDALELQP